MSFPTKRPAKTRHHPRTGRPRHGRLAPAKLFRQVSPEVRRELAAKPEAVASCRLLVVVKTILGSHFGW